MTTRAQVLASMQFPQAGDVQKPAYNGASLSVEDMEVVDLHSETQPFFGGYMEDMLEDMGVSHTEEAAEPATPITFDKE